MNCCREMTINVAASGSCMNWSTLDWNNEGDYFIDLQNGATGTVTPTSGLSSSISMVLDSGSTETGQAEANNAAWLTHSGDYCNYRLRITVSSMSAMDDPHDGFLMDIGVYNYIPNYTGGTGLATTNFTGTGTGLVVDVAQSGGVVSSVAVGANPGDGGTGYVTGDRIGLVDATGAGYIGEVTASAGVVTAINQVDGSRPTSFVVHIEDLSVGVHDYFFAFPATGYPLDAAIIAYGFVFHYVAGTQEYGSFTAELSTIP